MEHSVDQILVALRASAHLVHMQAVLQLPLLQPTRRWMRPRSRKSSACSYLPARLYGTREQLRRPSLPLFRL